MKTLKQVQEYMDELFDKVWYVRSLSNHTPDELKASGTPERIIQQMAEAREKVIGKYGSDWYENLDNWEYGFLSGALATLRWVADKKEEDKRFLDT